MVLHHQKATFNRLPDREVIVDGIEKQKRRIAGPVSYLFYIMPVAERFGDRVYETAAQSLCSSGVEVTAEQLKKLAAELKTPEGRERYKQEKWIHISSITPVRQTE